MWFWALLSLGNMQEREKFESTQLERGKTGGLWWQGWLGALDGKLGAHEARTFFQGERTLEWGRYKGTDREYLYGWCGFELCFSLGNMQEREREKFESTQLEGEWGFMARSKVNQIGNYLNLNSFIGIYFIFQSTTMPYYLSPLNISPTNRAAICAPPC